MPTAVVPSTELIPGTVNPEQVPVPAPGPQDGFAAALEQQAAAGPGPRFDPTRLDTVSLGAMVGAFVDGSLPPPDAAGPSLAADGAVAAAGRTGDDWGISGGRPAGVAGPGTAVIDAGERYLGVPYKWGGTSASTGFDCSGFVQQVYADLGISLPRVSVDQSRAGVEVSGGLAAAQPGDLIFWRGNGSRPNHIGIYAGDNTMLVAPRTGDVVRYQEITRPPDAVRRVI
ncbi:MAG: C40 family peptidase [Nitriliruptoraceae bacterium]|nr:C40 family peptidase [Nitriliruptoraceae bacterium]